MPVVTGKTVGKQNVAKAGQNAAWTSAQLAAGLAVQTVTPLDCPGLPKLTWVVIQTGGAAGTFQPTIAIRRDTFNAGALLTFYPMGPASLLVPGVPSVFEFNAPVQAISAQITAPGAAVPPAAASSYLVYLFASG